MAIKEFRSRINGLGLAEAKNAIEHPDQAIDYYLRTGRYYNGNY
jgi:ribosomal protein L7/L12